MQSHLVKLLSPLFSTLKHQCAFSSSLLRCDVKSKLLPVSSIIDGRSFENGDKRLASTSTPLISQNDQTKGKQLLQPPFNSTDIIKRNSSGLGIFKKQPKHLRFSMKVKKKMIKFSTHTGKMVNMEDVTNRFFRLDWGAWIHTIPKRKKRLWKRNSKDVSESKMHVFAPPHMHLILDNMTTAYFKKKKYFVDDPYESYHSRTNFEPTKYKHLEGNVAKYYRYYAYDDKWNTKPFKHNTPEFDLMIMQKPRKRP